MEPSDSAHGLAPSNTEPILHCKGEVEEIPRQTWLNPQAPFSTSAHVGHILCAFRSLATPVLTREQEIRASLDRSNGRHKQVLCWVLTVLPKAAPPACSVQCQSR